jgi:hypothetical protein
MRTPSIVGLCSLPLLVVPILVPATVQAQRPGELSEAVMEFVSVDAETVAITGVRIIDGTGGPARENMTVVFVDGEITEVAPAGRARVSMDATLISGAGKTLTPGWVMLHEHMFYPSGQGRYNTNEISFPPLYLAGGAGLACVNPGPAWRGEAQVFGVG